MNNKKNNLFKLIILILFISCQFNNKKKSIDDFDEYKYDDSLIQVNQDTFYPFSKTKFIKIFSYSVFASEESHKDSTKALLYKDLLEPYRIYIYKNRIKETITLSDTTNITKLFNLLYKKKCKLNISASCYNPRHCFVFYDYNNQPFSALEICLECMNSNSTENVKPPDFCLIKQDDLKMLLKSFGITYFKENEHNKNKN